MGLVVPNNSDLKSLLGSAEWVMDALEKRLFEKCDELLKPLVEKVRDAGVNSGSFRQGGQRIHIENHDLNPKVWDIEIRSTHQSDLDEVRFTYEDNLITDDIWSLNQGGYDEIEFAARCLIEWELSTPEKGDSP